MDIILLERIRHLGQMGDVVKVKPGYARNYLLPQGKALRATNENIAFFEQQKQHLEAKNLEERKEAQVVGEKVDGTQITLIRQAGETGQLYGSVSVRDIAVALSEQGFAIDKNQVILDHPIKTLGLHSVIVHLHPEVEVTVSVNVARSEQEAEAQRADAEAMKGSESVEEMFETKELAERAEEELAATAEELSETGEEGGEEEKEEE